MDLEQFAQVYMRISEEVREKRLDASTKLGQYVDLFNFIPEHRKKSKIPDLNAILLLSQLSPDHEGDCISCAEHDQVVLAFNPEIIAKNASEDDIHDIICSGIYYNDGEDYFEMVI